MSINCRIFKSLWGLMAPAMACAFLLASCQDPVSDEEEGEIELSVPETEVAFSAGSEFVKVTAAGLWKLDIEYAGEGGWLSLEQTQGTGTVGGITLSWEENSTGETREALLVLTSGSKRCEKAFSQGYSAGPVLPSKLKPDPVPDWMELPATNDKDLYFFTHDMTIKGKKYRNYSYYLDPAALISRWVAYPLNSTLSGSGSRTDVWGLDPKVPRDYQPVLYKAFATDEQGQWYDRGHQIPSADRLAPGSNEQTFYGVNMTPQLSKLNSNAWACLEGMVRMWSTKCDTLYVVTGADITGSTRHARDNEGKKVTVPVGYYKVLLSYNRSANQPYRGIAFYFEHREYESTSVAVMKQSMSIDDLEKKLGMDFFVNLPAASADADKIEATVESWWSSNI